MQFEIWNYRIALLSQEGSGIAKRIPPGVVLKPHRYKVRFGTTPALRATPPDSGGAFSVFILKPASRITAA
jgi:hypothetical protein